MGDTRFCICCNEQVPFSIVERDEQREVTCAYCGFTLDVEKLQKKTGRSGGIALVAEDSLFTRKIIQELIVEKHFSERVKAFENGLDLISAYGKILMDKEQVDVAIIDLNMPVMDGLTAARTMRTLERQNNAPKVQIVFFSAVKADANLRAQMEQLEPANYVNKGNDSDPEKLIARVEMLLAHLLEKNKERWSTQA